MPAVSQIVLNDELHHMTDRNYPLKICIPYEDQAQGGVYTFLSYFRLYLDAHEIRHTRSLWSRYDVLFINSFKTPYHKVRIARLLHPKARVVHRIDGSAEDYGRGPEWDVIQRKVNELAHLTIFQSRYARYATREKFPVIDQDGPVIHNPVDTKLFSPRLREGPKESVPRVAYVSFSTNPNKGADAALQIAGDNRDLDFVLIGPFKGSPGLENVRQTGYLERMQVAEVLRTCDVSLFFSKNEACPNVVLEAMASGLPVLYLDSGATSELVGEAGMAVTPSSFRKAFDAIWSDWHAWSARARKRAVTRFSVEKIVPEYLQVIRNMKGVSKRAVRQPCV